MLLGQGFVTFDGEPFGDCTSHGTRRAPVVASAPMAPGGEPATLP
jgi:hypothetical protein